MSHTSQSTPADLRQRFVQAAGYWTSPGIRPNEAQFRELWFGSQCAFLEYAAATGADFDDETEKCLSKLVALPAEKYEAAATSWLQRIHGPKVNVPKGDVTKLVNSVTAIVHALAAVQHWRLSRWGGDLIAIESARIHVKTCWQSYAAALPVDGPPKMHDCNHYLHDTKLSGLMALLNEPTTATHWLMLQRLFDHLLQNASDDQATRTRSASEATEPLGAEKASLARRVRLPAPEHEVRTHLVGVPVYDKTEPRTESERPTVTKLLTVSRVAEGPTGWYLDPIALGATRIDPEILNQLQLSWRVATSERQAHRAATVRERTSLNTPLPDGRGSPSNSDEPLSPLRITIASDGLPLLEGRSAGGLLLLSLHAAANDGFLREDTTASFDIQPIREVQNGLNRSAHHAERDGYVVVTAPRDERNVPQHPTELRLSDIQALPVDSETIKQKNFGLDDAPYIKRFLAAQTQTVRDANGPETTFANWSQQHATRYPVDFVPITNALDAWQQISGGPQIEAIKRYLNGVINQANNVANYLLKSKDMPAIRVQVRVRTELFQTDEHSEDERKAYEHPMRTDEERRGEHAREVILDWDDEVRSTIRRALLIGDPGFGKSWLLWHEAQVIAESERDLLARSGSIESVVLPVRVALPELAASIKSLQDKDQRHDLPAALRHTLHLRQQVDPFVIDRIIATLGTDRCVLLLDGWDEVVGKSLKDELQRCLKEWCQKNHGGRLFVTSRVINRPAEFWPSVRGSTTARVLQLQPFNDAQIHSFIQRFFSQQPQAATTLIAALQQAPQLRGLSQTPLLLSFLCRYADEQLHRPRKSMKDSSTSALTLQRKDESGPPELDLRSLRRNELYGYIVRSFLESGWNRQHQTLDELDVTMRLDVLSETAYLLFKEGYQRFTLGEFSERLQFARNNSPHDQDLPASLCADLVRYSGLVVPDGVGPDTKYLFPHLTFQEYLAAQHLKSRPWSEVEPVLGKLWDHSDWQEVWDLLVRENADDPQYIEQMVSTIRKRRHSLDKHLQRDRFAAIRWIMLACVEPTTETPISNHCLQWSRNLIAQRRPRYLFDELIRLLSRTIGRLPACIEDIAINHLADDRMPRHLSMPRRLSAIEILAPHVACPIIQNQLLLKIDDGDWRISGAVLRAVAQHAGNSTLQAALLRRLDDQSSGLRIDIVEALATHANSPNLQAALLRRLDSQSSDVRKAIVEALAPYANSPNVQTSLLRRINDDDVFVFTAIVEALAPHTDSLVIQDVLRRRIGDLDYLSFNYIPEALTVYAGSPTCQAELWRRFDEDDEDMCIAIVDALAPHAESLDLQANLLRQLENRNKYVRNAVAWALRPFAGNSILQAELLRRINDRRKGVRVAVIEALAPHADTPILLAELLRRIDDKNEEVRIAVVEALSPYADTPAVQAALLRRIDDRMKNVRRAIVDALAPHADNPSLQAELLRCINDKNEEVRIAVVQALSPYAETPAVQAALLRRIDDPKSLDWVIEALAPHVGSPNLQFELLQRIDDRKTAVRDAIVRLLAPHTASPIVQTALLRHFSSHRFDKLRTDLRHTVVQALAPYAENPTVKASLLERIEDWSETTRESIVRALAPYADHEHVQTAFLKQLNDEDLDVRRAVVQALQALALRERHPSTERNFGW